jgi:hypothetical protein
MSLSWGLVLLAIVAAAPQRPVQGALQAGDKAPDFNLKLLDKDASFKLSSNFGKRPTFLIFGSYT